MKTGIDWATDDLAAIGQALDELRFENIVTPANMTVCLYCGCKWAKTSPHERHEDWCLIQRLMNIIANAHTETRSHEQTD